MVYTTSQTLEAEWAGTYNKKLFHYHTFISNFLPFDDETILATATGFFIQPRETKGPFGLGLTAVNHSKYFQFEILLHGSEVEITEAEIPPIFYQALIELYERPMKSPPPDIVEGTTSRIVIYSGNPKPVLPDPYTLSTIATLIIHPVFIEKSHMYKGEVLTILSAIETSLNSPARI